MHFLVVIFTFLAIQQINAATIIDNDGNTYDKVPAYSPLKLSVVDAKEKVKTYARQGYRYLDPFKRMAFKTVKHDFVESHVVESENGLLMKVEDSYFWGRFHRPRRIIVEYKGQTLFSQKFPNSYAGYFVLSPDGKNLIIQDAKNYGNGAGRLRVYSYSQKSQKFELKLTVAKPTDWRVFFTDKATEVVHHFELSTDRRFIVFDYFKKGETQIPSNLSVVSKIRESGKYMVNLETMDIYNITGNEFISVAASCKKIFL